MQRGRAYSRGTNPWKITPSPLKAIERWVESLPVALKNPVGEPYSGTDPKRLWLLRSRPDQVHRRTMRRGPPTGILAELRFACLQPSGRRAPGGGMLPPPRPSPRGGGRDGFASLAIFGSLRFALLARLLACSLRFVRFAGLLLCLLLYLLFCWLCGGAWGVVVGVARWVSSLGLGGSAHKPSCGLRTNHCCRSIQALALGKYRAARATRPSRAVTWVQ